MLRSEKMSGPAQHQILLTKSKVQIRSGGVVMEPEYPQNIAMKLLKGSSWFYEFLAAIDDLRRQATCTVALFHMWVHHSISQQLEFDPSLRVTNMLQTCDILVCY